MKQGFKPIYLIVIAIFLLIFHFAVVSYVHINYVHVGSSFLEHFISLKHLTIDEKLNRLLTTLIVFIFALISAIFYKKNCNVTQKIKNIYDELEQKYTNLLSELDSQSKFFSNILDNSPIAVFVIDRNHKVILWNKACENLTGLNRKELIGTSNHWMAFYKNYRPLLADLVLMKDYENFAQDYDRFASSVLVKNGLYAEKYFENLGGNRRYIIFDAAPIYNENREIVAVIETIQDITETKKIEKKLSEREEIFSKLANSTSAAIFIYDQTGFKYGNKMCETLSGYKLEELYKMNFYDLVHPDMKEIARERGLRRLSGENIEKRYEMKIITKSGEIKWVDFTSDIIDYKGKKMAIGTAYDITEKKKLEETFIHSQKMDAIVRLSAGVAHDFNNILTAVIGFASLIEMTSSEDNIKKQAKNIILASERASELTKGLLAFSRKQIFNIRNYDINELINSIYKIIRRLIGEDIELKINLTNDRLISKLDCAQIESAILNLCTNARDAMPNGGILTIETSLFKPDDIFKKKYGYENGEMFGVIAVSDTGYGIPENIKEKIFEPFFTTKELGKGTGLGLATVYGIVKQHNGYINVYSELGKGTTFKIYLPLTSESTSPTRNIEHTQQLTGRECILLAEDEDMVRLINKEALEHFGYKVLEAKDGLEAYEIFKTNSDKIDLVILDVVMPKMNGKEVYEKIKQIKENIKAIFLSGYTENLIHTKGILGTKYNFISKPVSPTELVKKVRELIDDKK